jgi:putative tryptophan/tyrosine transport system substrate-binding protein
MRRREFITLLGGAATAWPLAARAQQPQRMRRIGVFMAWPSDDPVTQANAAELLQALQELGWAVGRNVQIEWRWYVADAARARKDAEDLVALAPDVIVAFSGATLAALVRTGHAVPIVFFGVVDPVGAGYVTSLARPGGHVTGFASFDISASVKWLQLLKEIAPSVTRVLVFRAAATGGASQFGAIQGVAPAMGVELRPVDSSNRDEIERAVGELARNPNGGLIVTGSAGAAVNRELIVALAVKHRLPAVYPDRRFIESGGLICYGAVRVGQVHPIAGYVDRILKGEKPGDLPVQAPTKYETVLNLKTAKALGLTLPPGILALADEVIE